MTEVSHVSSKRVVSIHGRANLPETISDFKKNMSILIIYSASKRNIRGCRGWGALRALGIEQIAH